jgi:uncharacterized RDD family membrane protein YckC
MEENKYAELVDRLKAAITDGLVFVGLMFLVTNIFSTMENVPTSARIIAFIGIFGLYEPLFVSLFGGTIGHYVNGLRVKRDNNLKKNIAFPMAIVRYFIKMILGIISLFTVSSNDESKAIHDTVVHSVVIKVK